MQATRKIDMTKGPMMKLILLFALPICLGNVLQQFYTMVDTLVVGNFCSSASLAAVGTSSQPVEIFLCVFLGIGSGVSILVSQATGKGDREYIRHLVTTSTAFLYITSIPLTILGFFFGSYILKFMQVPADTWDLSVTYLQIIFLGTLGNMGYNMNAGILRGVGDSRSSLLFLIISCAMNIVLDLVFVIVFHMDVAGVALATTIAQFISWIFSIIYILKKYPELKLPLMPKYIDKKALKEILSIGLPLGLNSAIYSIGHILQQSLINEQGSIYMAASTVGSKICTMSNIAVNSFGSAVTTFAGQNLGAKNYRRLKQGACIPFVAGGVTLFLGVLLSIFCKPVLRLFTQDPAVLELAMLYCRVILPFTCFYATFSCLISYANGIGIVKYTTVINLLTLWAVRIPSSWFIARYINGIYVMASISISFLFGFCCMLLFFLSKRWKEIKQKAAA